MAPNDDEMLGEMENEDNEAAAPKQHSDNGNDAQDDEDHLQDHQGEEGSPEQWDQGGDDFGADVSSASVYFAVTHAVLYNRRSAHSAPGDENNVPSAL